MNDARLNLGFRESRLNGLGEAFEAVDDGNQNVLNAPVA
jgi:hypothetical protein